MSVQTEMQIFEVSVYGARIFHTEARHLFGALGLPPAFVALHGDRLLIVGEPPKDVIHCAMMEAGFNRFDVTRAAPGEGRKAVTGLLIDLCV